EELVVEGVDVGIRVAAENGAEAGDDLPLLRSVVGDEGGGGVVAAAGEAPGPGPHVPVGLFQQGGARQDDVGVAGGLVDIDVEAHHALQHRQRLDQPL